MSSLTLQLFGSFGLADNGTPIQVIRQTRHQALLAYLALFRDEVHLRHDLADLLWPEKPTKRARANFRKALHYLRANLPNADQLLVVDQQTVQWQTSAPVAVDVIAFEAALDATETSGEDRVIDLIQRAIEHYRDDLLPNFSDEWILIERERLQQRHQRALIQLIELLERRRDYAEAIATAQRLLRHDPLNEIAYRALMSLHSLQGNSALALQSYHDCLKLLAEELGSDPSEQTQTLFLRLLQSRSIEVRRPNPDDVHQAALVGRVDEWRQLQDSWQAAKRWGGYFAFLSGEAGIGKSRLIQEMQAWAQRQGILTAYARSYEAEGDLPYGPVSEWLRVDAPQLTLFQLDDVWLVEIARLLPIIYRLRPDLPQPEPMRERWQRQRLFSALAHAILILNQPLLLFADDLHWSDQETIEWLHYLLRAARDRECYPYLHTKLLVVGAARSEELGPKHPLTTCLSNLQHESLMTEIPLSALDMPTNRALIEQIGGGKLKPAEVDAIVANAGGIPLYAVEYVNEIESRPAHEAIHDQEEANFSSIPSKISNLIQRQLERLSPQAQEVAAIAAVYGRAIAFETLYVALFENHTFYRGETYGSQANRTVAKSSMRTEEELLLALDELEERNILREQSTDLYDFTHDLTRTVAYWRLRQSRRRLYHRRVGEMLVAIYANDLDAVSNQIAYHYQESHKYREACQYYYRAAMIAQRIFAFNDALHSAESALMLMEKRPTAPLTRTQLVDLQMLRGMIYAETLGYAAPEAAAAYQQALVLCKTIDDVEKRSTIRYGIWQYQLVHGLYDEAEQLAQTLLREAEEVQQPLSLLVGHIALGVTYVHMGNPRAGIKQMQVVTEIYKQLAPPLQQESQVSDVFFIAQSYLYFGLYLCGFIQQCPVILDRLKTVETSSASPSTKAFTLGLTAGYTYFIGQHQVARECLIKGQRIAAEYRLQYVHSLATILEHWMATDQVLSKHELGMIHEQLQQVIANGARSGLSHYLLFLADLCYRAKEYAFGLTVVEEALALIEEIDEAINAAEVYRVHAQFLLALDPAAIDIVVERLEEAIDSARAIGTKTYELRAALDLARLWALQDERSEAYTLLSGIVAWFADDATLPELETARALLQVLSPQ